MLISHRFIVVLFFAAERFRRALFYVKDNALFTLSLTDGKQPENKRNKTSNNLFTPCLR